MSSAEAVLGPVNTSFGSERHGFGIVFEVLKVALNGY